MHSQCVLAIVGPTGVGKSAVAQLVAQQLGSAVLSADSMQVYRMMNIGTAKVTLSEQAVAHYGIDLVDPGEAYSAAEYQTYARGVIDELLSHNAIPVVCGGTGLYVSSALDSLTFKPELDSSEIRDKWTTYWAKHGTDALYEKLIGFDPPSAHLIHPNNVKRVVRALEMYELGSPYSEHATNFKQRTSIYNTCFIGLTADRAVLYERVNRRVDEMMHGGLLDEVRILLDAGYQNALTASQAIGYKELVDCVNGKKSVDVAVEEIKQATRRYAKRQLTWFRADKRVLWIDTTSIEQDSVASEVMAVFDRYRNGSAYSD